MTKAAANISDILFKWDDLSDVDIANKFLGGLSALVGGAVGFSIAGIPGAIVGATAGLILSAGFSDVLLNYWKTTDKRQKIADILTGLLGGIIGFEALGAKGAIIGTIAGIALSAKVRSLGFDGSGIDSSAVQKKLRNVLEAAICVFSLFKYGPAGFVAAFALSLIVEGALGEIKIQGWKPMGPTLAEKMKKEVADNALKGVTAGLTSGLKAGKKSIESAVDSDMAQPIISKFKSTMQIHSPSKVSEGWGKNIIIGLLNGFKNTMNLVLTWVPSFGSLLSGKFTSIGDSIVTTFQNMKGRVYSIFDGLKNVLRTPLNGIIGFLNRLISGVVSGINTAIRAINRIKVTIPSWIPKVGGKSIGFHLSTITAPTIPYLATGAVIPPNAPFTAVLGDQRNGTNLEAPESLIRKIVREESGSGNYRFTAQINRRTLFDEMISEAKIRQSATGKNPFVMA